MASAQPDDSGPSISKDHEIGPVSNLTPIAVPLVAAPSYSSRAMTGVLGAWHIPYQGTADSLHMIIRSYMNVDDSRPLPYARYAPFIQSSGTGKSRMNDELAKKILNLPINLAHANANVFPPPDDGAGVWFDLLQRLNIPENELATKVQAFMCALFVIARDCLEEVAQEIGYARETAHVNSRERYVQLASRFRDKMNADMQFGQHGKYRIMFYKDVYKKAQEFSENHTGGATYAVNLNHIVLFQKETPDGRPFTTVKTAAEKLIDFVYPGYPNTRDPAHPVVIVCFDEAHTLYAENDTTWTLPFAESQRRYPPV